MWCQPTDACVPPARGRIGIGELYNASMPRRPCIGSFWRRLSAAQNQLATESWTVVPLPCALQLGALDWEFAALHRRTAPARHQEAISYAPPGIRSIFDASADPEARRFVKRARRFFAELARPIFAGHGYSHVDIPVDDGVLQYISAPARGHIAEWHRDDSTWPALSVFVPLLDANVSTGQLEIQQGTASKRRFPGPPEPFDIADATPGYSDRYCNFTTPVAPLVRRGEALVFDARLLHRGRANYGHVDRPLLVFGIWGKRRRPSHDEEDEDEDDDEDEDEAANAPRTLPPAVITALARRGMKV